ncbi:hypothetical protein [Streptomyces sp. JHA26]|uniref:hypothetical protein n=1 Tax=Streptomyces sp. JHA26 TaxID=1917143 RepID=UPI0027D8BAF8|nr:hypothetical protein [Streptomyces sp. JHA26]
MTARLPPAGPAVDHPSDVCHARAGRGRAHVRRGGAAGRGRRTPPRRAAFRGGRGTAGRGDKGSRTLLHTCFRNGPGLGATLWGSGESPVRSHRDPTHEETIISAIRKTLTATAVVGAVLAGPAACGTAEQLSAGQKLDQAFDKLGKEKSVSFELDLDTDAKTLKALDAKSDPEPGEEIPDEVAELLSGVKVSITVESKKPLEDSGEEDFAGMAMKISSPDGDLVEYRVVDDQVYIRSDVENLGKAMGSPMPSVEDLPSEAGGLKNAFEGKWVKFSIKEMEDLAAEGEEGGDAPAPEPSLDAKTQKKLVKALRGVVAREVELKTSDGEGGAEHVTATAPFRTLITELLDEIRPLAEDLPPGMDLPTDKDLKDAPDTDVTADFTLENGELTEVDLDLAALAEDADVKKLGLTLRISDGVRPTAPAGATELDLAELTGGLFAGLGAMDDEEFDESGLAGPDFPEDEF